MNDKVGSYIKSYLGVRQGDLSPILFIFAEDSLTKMVENAHERNLFTKLIDHIIPIGVGILQYTNDTVLLKHDLEGARNLKLLLYMYEMIARLKINFNKSDVIEINDDYNWGQVYADIFKCQIGLLSIKYLGSQLAPADFT